LQPCNLYVCAAAAIQQEMQMAVIMNIAALKLCCKEADEQACPVAARPRTRTVAGTRPAACPLAVMSIARVHTVPCTPGLAGHVSLNNLSAGCLHAMSALQSMSMAT